MTTPAAHTSPYAIAEVVFGIPLLASLILGVLIPLPLSAFLSRVIGIALGVILILSGLWIIVETRRQFRQSGQPTDPGHPTTQLITTGIFAYSRNPLYLGAVVFFIGLAALLDSLWLLILLIPTLAAVHLFLIAPEERYLRAKFGEDYGRYCRSVHRWIGRR